MVHSGVVGSGSGEPGLGCRQGWGEEGVRTCAGGGQEQQEVGYEIADACDEQPFVVQLCGRRPYLESDTLHLFSRFFIAGAAGPVTFQH